MNGWDDVVEILEEERALLIDGRLTDLMDISERKVAALQAVEAAHKASAPPVEVRALAERNAQLLEAAGRGIKSAVSRLKEIQSAVLTTTYDARGGRHALTGPAQKQGSKV